MTRRYYIIFFIVSLIIVLASSSIKVSEKKLMAGSVKHNNEENIQQLIKDSTLIIVGDVKGKKENVKENKVNYTVSEVKVQEILKGNILLSSDIVHIMQLDTKQDPAVMNGEKVLLFLEPYGDSKVENGFVCVGLCQGYYKLQGDKAIPSAVIPYSLKESIEDEKNVIDYVKMQAAVVQE